MKYFSYHPDDGFNLHETEDYAKTAAQEALDYERSEACEGWSDYVDMICWGEVRQITIETMRRPRNDEDTYVSDCCETIIDYDLIDVK